MRPDLPRGTVTFLFTDIERSTRLLRQLGQEKLSSTSSVSRASELDEIDRVLGGPGCGLLTR
jgi:class 3 adenylate cyclase